MVIFTITLILIYDHNISRILTVNNSIRIEHLHISRCMLHFKSLAFKCHKIMKIDLLYKKNLSVQASKKIIQPTTVLLVS